MKTEKENEVYETNQLYESAFLVSFGFNFTGIKNNGNTKYSSILFKDSPELQKAVSDFNNNAPVPVLTFINSYKRCKEVLFRGI